MSEKEKTNKERNWWTRQYLYPNWYALVLIPAVSSISAVVGYKVMHYLVFGY